MEELSKFITNKGKRLELKKSQEMKFDRDVIITIEKGVIFVKHHYNNGVSRILNILKPESVQYMDKVYVTLKAKSEVRLNVMSKDFFDKHATEECRKEFNIALLLQNARMSMLIRDMTFHDKGLNLIACLIKLSNTFGVKTREGILIDITLTHKELSELSMLTRESVSRNLKILSEAGLLKSKHKKYLILDIEQMKSKLNCEDCPEQYCSFG